MHYFVLPDYLLLGVKTMVSLFFINFFKKLVYFFIILHILHRLLQDEVNSMSGPDEFREFYRRLKRLNEHYSELVDLASVVPLYYTILNTMASLNLNVFHCNFL